MGKWLISLTTLAAFCLPAGNAFAQTQESKLEAVERLPVEYHGRWALISLSGEVERPNFEDCKGEGYASASLVIGPDWSMSPWGYTRFLSIKRSGDDGFRVEVVSGTENRLAVSIELFSLLKNGARLEIASNPEVGWDVTRYARCPGVEF